MTARAVPSGLGRRRRGARTGLKIAVAALILLILASVLPPLIINQLKLVNKDIHAVIHTEPSPALVIDPSVASGDPACARAQLPARCHQTDRAEMQRTLEFQVVPPSGKSDVTIEATDEIERTDGSASDSTFSYVEDRVRLVRHSAFPVDKPYSSEALHLPSMGVDRRSQRFTRGGLQYQFPFSTEKRSYQFFDTIALTATPIDYQDKEYRGAEQVYRFHQEPGPVNLHEAMTNLLGTDGELSAADNANLAKLRTTGRADYWYTPAERKAKHLGAAQQVVMDRYYATARTVWVEPKTGVIVNAIEHPRFFYAASPEEAAETAKQAFAPIHGDSAAAPDRSVLAAGGPRVTMATTLAWDAESQDGQWRRARPEINTLEWVLRLQYLANTLGVIVLIAGVVQWRRHAY